MTGILVQFYAPEVNDTVPGELPQYCYVWATYEDRHEAEIEFFTLKGINCYTELILLCCYFLCFINH